MPKALYKVFPAQAGMNRHQTRSARKHPRVPRTGGDEPGTVEKYLEAWRCSPHRRG